MNQALRASCFGRIVACVALGRFTADSGLIEVSAIRFLAFSQLFCWAREPAAICR